MPSIRLPQGPALQRSGFGQRGKAVFAQKCATCHSGSAFTGSGSNTLVDVGTLKASSGNRLGGPLTGIDVPTLRDVWATAPYLHDGSAWTLEAAVQAHTNLTLNGSDLLTVTETLARSVRRNRRLQRWQLPARV